MTTTTMMIMRTTTPTPETDCDRHGPWTDRMTPLDVVGGETITIMVTITRGEAILACAAPFLGRATLVV